MKKKVQAIFVTNGGFFIPSNIMPLGSIYRLGCDLTRYPLCYRRGVIYQTIVVGIGWKVPQHVLFSLEAGPVLIANSQIIASYQWFKPAFWNERALRNIVATKGHRVYFIRIKDSLWGCAKYLKKRGFEYAINLDGGSSCTPGEIVANAIVVLPKTRADYQRYKNPLWMPKEETGIKVLTDYDFPTH